VPIVDQKAPEHQSEAARGFYGLEITGLDDASPFLLAVGPEAPRMTLVQERAAPDRTAPATGPGTVWLTDDAAEVWVSPHDTARIDRATLTVRFTTRDPIDDAAIVHPFLAFPSAVATHWLDRLAIHGGAFAHAARAWGLLGDKGGGKSSTLGWLMHTGHDILSDDLLAVDGRTLFPGPRSIDLRGDAAERFGGDKVAGMGARERWRLHPAEPAPALPLGGFIHLEWGDHVAVESLGAAERLARLFHHSVLRAGAEEASAYLDLASLPAWRFVRPPGLDGLGRANAQLLGALG
jgi:hypothetical protein